jgi:transcriptional/translational regulatory protein YebC/TACO1
MFERIGLIVYGADKASSDDIFEAALEAGAQDVESGDEAHEITCEPDDFSTVRDALEGAFGYPDDARLDWKPHNSVAVDEDTASTLLKLLDVLEDNDDVQRVAANFDVDDNVLERLSA